MLQLGWSLDGVLIFPMSSLIGGRFVAWNPMDVGSQVLVPANPLARCPGPPAHVRTFAPLALELIVDLRRPSIISHISAHRAVRPSRAVRPPFHQALVVEAVSVVTDPRVVQDF